MAQHYRKDMLPANLLMAETNGRNIAYENKNKTNKINRCFSFKGIINLV
jgi:hypothetical protein